MEDTLLGEPSDKPQEPRTNPSPKILTKAKPINNTFLRHFLVLAAVKLLKRIVTNHGALLFISDKLCIKYSSLKNHNTSP